MSFFHKENRNLLIIAVIAIVNALGYGIIIPILYTYSKKFGMTDFQNGLLFALFSVCQFISTPIIGRLSDKFGRRPLLITSLAGTALSFVMLAFAPNIVFLFLARALDGITAGNIPVAQAVISDTTTEENRAKGFGVIGASFGFGFVFGPAISALTVGISPALPFLIAAAISIFAVILTTLVLPETNKHMGEVSHGKLIDFSKMYHALFDPNIGITMIITFIYSFAFACAIIYGFQPYAIHALHLTGTQIAQLFTVFGVVGLIAQVLVIPTITKKFGIHRPFQIAFLLTGIAFIAMAFTRTMLTFTLMSVFLGLVSSFINPLIQAILSEETDAKSQGSIFGINASYMSVGQIFGPVIGGAIATISVAYPFLLGGAIMALCFWLSFYTLKTGHHQESAF